MKLRENVGFGENDEVAHSVLWLLVENLVVWFCGYHKGFFWDEKKSRKRTEEKSNGDY